MPKSQPIRVLLVDDHEILRNGMTVIFELFDDLRLVGLASSGEEAVALCQVNAPDVVLLDLVMPGMDGVMAARLIRQQNPAIQVVVLTSFEDEDLVKSAWEAGISEYLLKDITLEEIVAALRRAAGKKAGLAG